MMQSLAIQLFSTLDRIYGGWILWNLFLAFIPLVLSYLLFRRQSIARPWLWWFCGLVGFMGTVGFLAKLPFVWRDRLAFLQAVMLGNPAALLRFSWLGVLALIACGLSIGVFKHRNSFRSWLWWLGLVVFIAFLPNAPYVLTDIIHLIRAIGSGYFSVWVITLIVIPVHLCAIFLGFEAYVISLLNQGAYLKRRGAERLILPAELLVHGLCAVGIFLGRFIRLNSWDIVTDPSNVLMVTLNTLTAKRPLMVMVITFIVLTGLYWIMKQMTLGLKFRLQYRKAGHQTLDSF